MISLQQLNIKILKYTQTRVKALKLLLIQNKIKDKISSMSHLNISIDIWTDATMRSYIGYIVSGINDKWQIVHHTLDFKLLKKRHTGDAIKEAYDQLCFDNRNFFLF